MTSTLKHMLYDWNGANVALFHWINGIDGGAHDALMLFGTAISDHRNFAFYMCAIAVCAAWQVHRAALRPGGAVAEPSLRWVAAIAVFCLAYLIDGAVLSWIKTSLAYPRPPLALPPGSLRILGEPEYKLSFPSGHASFAGVLVVSLWPLFNSAWRIAGVVFLLWVALSRISVGAHFPADVVGSYLIAVPIVIAVRRAVNGYLAVAREKS